MGAATLTGLKGRRRKDDIEMSPTALKCGVLFPFGTRRGHGLYRGTHYTHTHSKPIGSFSKDRKMIICDARHLPPFFSSFFVFLLFLFLFFSLNKTSVFNGFYPIRLCVCVTTDQRECIHFDIPEELCLCFDVSSFCLDNGRRNRIDGRWLKRKERKERTRYCERSFWGFNELISPKIVPME